MAFEVKSSVISVSIMCVTVLIIFFTNIVRTELEKKQPKILPLPTQKMECGSHTQTEQELGFLKCSAYLVNENIASAQQTERICNSMIQIFVKSC